MKSLDALLDAELAPGRPSEGFDARFAARLAQEADAPEAALDLILQGYDEPAAAEDAVTPSPGFDARFAARLAAEQAAEDAALDRLLALDQPTPTPGFDARVQAAIAAEAPRAKVLPFALKRALWIAAPLAAAAALVLWLRPVAAPPPAPAAPVVALAEAPDLELLENLDMLEDFEAIELLDGLEDPAVFALVAQLDTLPPELVDEAIP